MTVSLTCYQVNQFVFDYRGYGFSRGHFEPTEDGLIADATAALHLLDGMAQKGEIARDRIFLAGPPPNPMPRECNPNRNPLIARLNRNPDPDSDPSSNHNPNRDLSFHLGRSLGGAVVAQLAAKLGRDGKKSDLKLAGVIIENSFTSMPAGLKTLSAAH